MCAKVFELQFMNSPRNILYRVKMIVCFENSLHIFLQEKCRQIHEVFWYLKSTYFKLKLSINNFFPHFFFIDRPISWMILVFKNRGTTIVYYPYVMSLVQPQQQQQQQPTMERLMFKLQQIYKHIHTTPFTYPIKPLYFIILCVFRFDLIF